MDTDLRLDHSLVAVETDSAVFGILELTAPEAPAVVERPSLGIALVIDRSGSMTGEKLEAAKSCAGYLARRITSADRLAVVTYDDQVDLVAGTQGPGPNLESAIGKIEAGGSTNLSGGWLKGLEMLEGEKSDLRRVVLLTDGLANVGITDAERLSSMTGAAAVRGVTTSTIGFGDGYDEKLLASMADAGRGRDYFVATPDEAPGVFADEFEQLSSLVGQNLSVEFRPLAPAIDLGILNEYPVTHVGQGLQAGLGDVYGGETRKLVFHVHVPALAEQGQVQVAEVVIRWTDITGEEVKLHTRTVPIVVNIVPAKDAADEAGDISVTEEVVILKAAKGRRQARDLADQGDLDGARALLASHIDELKLISPDSAVISEATADIEELEWFEHRLESRVFDRTDSKMMWEQSRSRERGQDYRRRKRP
ncbi:MAG TPA: VWA domain-containing protein [Acidimicrobiia bacterium]